MIANANRDPNKSDGWDWLDVFPEWKEEEAVEVQRTDEEMLAAMMMFASRRNKLGELTLEPFAKA